MPKYINISFMLKELYEKVLPNIHNYDINEIAKYSAVLKILIDFNSAKKNSFFIVGALGLTGLYYCTGTLTVAASATIAIAGAIECFKAVKKIYMFKTALIDLVKDRYELEEINKALDDITGPDLIEFLKSKGYGEE